MRFVRGATVGVLAVAMMLACGDAPERQPAATGAHERLEAGPLRVFVVSHPLETLAGRIGGEQVEVVFPAPSDVDPAYWLPEPEQVIEFQSADLIILNGAGYAGWVARATLPRSKLIDTSEGIRDRLLVRESGTTHSHGPAGEHSHGELAFTLWLDPTLAIEQARVLTEAFTRARPGRAAVFRVNQERLNGDLRALDERLARAAAALGGRPILYSHPVYAYLQQRYELNGRALHWEPDEAPSDAMWRELDDLLAAHPARLMLWEGEPAQAVVDALERRGIASVVFTPAGNRTADADWLAAMNANAARLERAAGGD